MLTSESPPVPRLQRKPQAPSSPSAHSPLIDITDQATANTAWQERPGGTRDLDSLPSTMLPQPVTIPPKLPFRKGGASRDPPGLDYPTSETMQRRFVAFNQLGTPPAPVVPEHGPNSQLLLSEFAQNVITPAPSSSSPFEKVTVAAQEKMSQHAEMASKLEDYGTVPGLGFQNHEPLKQDTSPPTFQKPDQVLGETETPSLPAQSSSVLASPPQATRESQISAKISPFSKKTSSASPSTSTSATTTEVLVEMQAELEKRQTLCFALQDEIEARQAERRRFQNKKDDITRAHSANLQAIIGEEAWDIPEESSESEPVETAIFDKKKPGKPAERQVNDFFALIEETERSQMQLERTRNEGSVCDGDLEERLDKALRSFTELDNEIKAVEALQADIAAVGAGGEADGVMGSSSAQKESKKSGQKYGKLTGNEGDYQRPEQKGKSKMTETKESKDSKSKMIRPKKG